MDLRNHSQKTKDQPLISVIITNYNYAKFVEQSIWSVINQTYNNIEIIIIDDGSTDGSDAVIQKTIKRCLRNITYIRQENQGVVEARNKGMELARGEYLCCLDADDFFDTEYIQKNYECAIKYDADVTYPSWRLVGDVNQKIDFPEFDFIEYQKQHLHVKPESLIRASAIKHKNGKLKYGYIPETKDRANDWAYFISLAANGLKFKLSEGNYINYRIKQGSMSSRFTQYENAKIFYNYLTMFREKYGEKIINPIDLPIDIMKQQEEKINNLKAMIQEKDRDIEVQANTIEVRNKQYTQEVDGLKRNLNDIHNSLSWKLTKPLRFLRRMLREVIGH